MGKSLFVGGRGVTGYVTLTPTLKVVAPITSSKETSGGRGLVVTFVSSGILICGCGF